MLADGKRGDVPHTAAAYAQALLGATETPWGTVHGLGADAVTANPLLGRDSLEPIVAAARARAAGVFVLVRTSNPGAAEIQDEGPPARCPLRRRLAALVRDAGRGRVGALRACPTWAPWSRQPSPGCSEAARAHAAGRLPVAGRGGPGRAGRGLLAPAFAGPASAALVAASRTIADAAIESGRPRRLRCAAAEQPAGRRLGRSPVTQAASHSCVSDRRTTRRYHRRGHGRGSPNLPAAACSGLAGRVRSRAPDCRGRVAQRRRRETRTRRRSSRGRPGRRSEREPAGDAHRGARERRASTRSSRGTTWPRSRSRRACRWKSCARSTRRSIPRVLSRDSG